MKTNLIFLLSCIIIVLYGCTPLNELNLSTPDFSSENDYNFHDTIKSQYPEIAELVRVGKVADNLKITAIDGSFTLTGGQTFKPSFFSDGWRKPGKGFAKKWSESNGKKVKIDYDYDVEDPEEEGKKINKKGEMFGILEFNRVYSECASLPVARSYYIQIPYSNIENALGGKISMFYEIYECQPTIPGRGKAKRENYTSWVIWLSDVPF